MQPEAVYTPLLVAGVALVVGSFAASLWLAFGRTPEVTDEVAALEALKRQPAQR